MRPPKKKTRRPTPLLLATVMACGAMPEASWAEESASSVIALPEISVTARKRQENPRDVPLSLTVVDGQTLEDARINSSEDLFRSVPNMMSNDLGDSRATYYTIRGIGPVTQPLGPDDSSVVTYVDGIPQPFFGSDLIYLDIDRAEVLRGPQGTLYGRNSAAGAINITTRKPGAEPEFSLRGEIGGDGTRSIQGVASGPLVPGRLAARLALKQWSADGYVPNLYGSDRGDHRNFAGRGSLLLTPSDRTTVTLGLAGESNKQNPVGWVLRQQADYPEQASTVNKADRRSGGAALTVAHDFGWGTLTSATGANRVVNELLTDDHEGKAFSALFGLPVAFFQRQTDFSDWTETETSFNQEFRLNSAAASAVSWVAGLNYAHSHLDTRYTNQSAFFASTNGTRDVDLTANSASAFGEVTVPVVARLKATGGLRFNHDWKKYGSTFTGNGFPGTVAGFHQSGDLTYNYVTGRASLAYDITDTSNVYATVSRGYKAGGFPRFPTDAAFGQATAPYKSATYWTYELGSKNEFLGGRARLNLAGFFTKARNEQLYAYNPRTATFQPANVDVRSYGFEAEGALRVASGLDLLGGFGYTVSNLENVAASLSATTGAASGNATPNVPRMNASLALQHRGDGAVIGLPSRFGTLGRLEVQHQGHRYADVGSQTLLKGYQLVNARVGVEMENADLYLFANNLFDRQYATQGNHLGPNVDAVLPARGRVIGVGAGVRF